MQNANLPLGVFAKRTECTVSTIRYYEEIGLLPHALGAANGRRHYGEADQERLLPVQRCRVLCFPIEQVRSWVALLKDGDRSRREIRDVAQDHLDAVRARILEFRQHEASLAAFVESSDVACGGGMAKDCTMIEDLSSSNTQSRKGCRGAASIGASAGTPGFVSLKRG